jgi:hypothetical protein
MVIAKERVESLVGESEPARFATEVREFDPHLRVFSRSDDERSNFQDSLPDVDISFASFETVA